MAWEAVTSHPQEVSPNADLRIRKESTFGTETLSAAVGTSLAPRTLKAPHMSALVWRTERLPRDLFIVSGSRSSLRWARI